MTEQEYRKAMERFAPAPGLRARTRAAVEARGEPDQPRARVRPLRTVLIAAAMCFALVGTAFAATAVVQRLTAQTGEWEDWGNEYTGYQIHGAPVFHPVEDFSPAFQEDFADWSHPSLLFHQEFDSWEKVTDYLGDKIPAAWHGVEGTQIDQYPLEFTLSAWHEMYGDNKIKRVEVWDSGIQLGYALGCRTSMTIYTPDYPNQFLDSEGWWKDEADFQVLDSYVMANGCVAEVVMGARDASYEDADGVTHSGVMRDCIGAFMKDGVLYKVRLNAAMKCPLDQAGLVEQLCLVLDSFQ